MAAVLRAAVSLARAVLITLITASVIAFVWSSWVVLTGLWSRKPMPWATSEDDPSEIPAMLLVYHAVKDRYGELGANIYPLQYSTTNAVVWL